MTRPDAPFTGEQVMQLLSDMTFGDRLLAADRLEEWMREFVPDSRAAFVFLWTLTEALIQVMGLEVPAGGMAAVELERTDGEPPWRLRIAAQLIGCRLNNDFDMMPAVLHSVTSNASVLPVVEVACELIGMFRDAVQQRTRSGGD